ncbi:MAG: hypothetical protein HY077_12255 [Elusimicrobia bacterium]|nr:hypothetical protein [Elusimicrobiota bacterium]
MTFASLARKPWAAALAVACLPLAAGIVYVAAHGAPPPIVHDEFSYLLAADTFAHGRLTNPAHPFFRHFQSVNELAAPTYMSKYPPAQGLFLAAGQVFAGAPIWGAVVSAALAAAAVYWMLLAFLPAEWAFFGGLLAGGHPLLFYWLTNYWGGAAALLGGALFVGAWKRAWDEPSRGSGLALAAGAALLANSRPLEGLALCVPLGASLFWKSPDRSKSVWAAFAGIMVLVGSWMAYYNWRVTGSPWKLPYLLYEETYNPAPLFVWQKGLREIPDPGVPEIRDLWREWNLGQYERQRSLGGLLGALKEKLADFDEAWLEPLPIKLFLGLALLGFCGPLALRLGLLWAFLSALVFPLLFYYPHYSAPAGALFFLLVVCGMRGAWDWRWRGRPVGRLLVIAATGWCLVRSVLFLGRKAANPRTAWSYYRLQALEEMKAMGGRHLVLVRYGRGSTYHDDWVANEADIDRSPVVWAWRLSEEEDRRLEQYYADRAVWSLDVVPPRPVFKLVRPSAGTATR